MMHSCYLGILYAVSYKRNVGGLVSKAMGASGRRIGFGPTGWLRAERHPQPQVSGRTPPTAERLRRKASEAEGGRASGSEGIASAKKASSHQRLGAFMKVVPFRICELPSGSASRCAGRVGVGVCPLRAVPSIALTV